MSRLIRWTRHLAGGALLFLAAYWTTRAIIGRPRPAPPPFRITPLTRAEAEASRILEAELSERPLTGVVTVNSV